MEFTTFLITVFCLVDGGLKALGLTDVSQRHLRRRGSLPQMSDSEVLTIEIVGEFAGIDTDKGLFGFVRRSIAPT